MDVYIAVEQCFTNNCRYAIIKSIDILSYISEMEERHMISMDTFAGGSFARQITEQKGAFSLLQYNKDSHSAAVNPAAAYYNSKMGVRKKQVIVTLNNTGVILQAGAMQMMLGEINAETNVKGVGDALMKAFAGRATGESAVKPRYTGAGFVVLEPTWKYILFEDLADWGGSITVDDGLFLACDDTVDIKTVARSSFSAAVAGGEGLFNTALVGRGVVALECALPRDELITIELENDTVKIDGNMAIAWSSNLQFTVEKTTKSLIGSAATGEGLVNVYRGTGKILVMP